MKKNVTDVSQSFEVVASNAKSIKRVADLQGNLSPFLLSESRKVKGVVDEVSDEIADDFVSPKDVVADSSTAAVPEYSILLAQADIAPQPYTIYITDTVESAPVNAEVVVETKSVGVFSGVSTWWWGGLGVAAIATGVGLSSSGGGSAKSPVNIAPIFDSGPTGSVDENAATSTIIYDANATDADAGSTITYSLKPATGDVAALDINATTGQVTLKVSADFETKSSYSFTVIASDEINSSEQAVTVNINNLDEIAPIITSGGTAPAIDENSGASQVIYTAVADDTADISAGVTFSLKTGSDAGLTIHATTGAVTLADNPDYETNSSYSFTVVAADGVNTPTEQLVTLAISDVNEAPVIISPNNGNAVSLSINEGIATVVTVIATNVDAGQTITYSIGGVDSTLFTINSSTGTVTFTTAPVYITGGDNTYNFTVIATDNGTGELSDNQDFSITINDLLVNPPTFSSGGIGSVDENALVSIVVYDAETNHLEGGALTYSLSGADADLVSVNPSTGEVTLNSSANFENKASYNFIVIADNGSAIAEEPVIITVNDINEAPTTTVVTLTAILEDSSARLITQAELLINAFDDDGDDLTAIELAISVGGTGTLVDNEDDTWSYTPALNADTPVSFSYNITDGTLISDGNATLGITPVNDAPIITSNDGGSTANVSVAATRTAVTTVTADDVDSDNLSYSITNTLDGALFHIDSSTGVLTFKVAPDFENPNDSDLDNIYDVQVTVSDGSLTDVQDISVFVTNYKNVVVESGVAYIDLNGDGVKDANDTILADFTPETGNVDLALNPVVIHYNNAIPSSPLNLSGFGSDDRIEIDVQAFIDNGHNALNILAVSGVKTLDNFRTAEGMVSYSSNSTTNISSKIVYNSHALIGSSGTFYSNSISYDGPSGPLNSKIGLRLLDNNPETRTLLFFSDSPLASTENNFTLASGLPMDMRLQDMVVFVNLPEL